MKAFPWHIQLAGLISSLFILLLAGCAIGSGIVTVGKDTYTLVQSGTTGFTPLGVLKSRAYQEANAFAEKKSKVMEVISVNEIPAGFAKWPQVEVRFRLLDTNAIVTGETRRVVETVSASSFDAQGRRTDTTKQVREIVPIGSQLDLAPEGGLYLELKQLDELRKSGILTEEEFQTQKSGCWTGGNNGCFGPTQQGSRRVYCEHLRYR